MNRILFTLATLASSTSVFATEYKCHSIDRQIETYLLFDDGPGGLDVFNVKAYGRNYVDVVFNDSPRSVIPMSDRNTHKDTFEYGAS